MTLSTLQCPFHWGAAPNMSTTRGQALLAALGHTVIVTGNKENTQNMNNTRESRRVREGSLLPKSCASSKASRRDKTVPLGHWKVMAWRVVCLQKVECPVIAQNDGEVKPGTKKLIPYSARACKGH